jgi:hypothetical protein
MKRMLLAAAGMIAVLSTVPAQAQDRSSGLSSMSGGFPGHDNRRNMRDRRHNKDHNQSDVVLDWSGGEWAYYNNQSWQPTSYNDWWHEEPWRAYPAWMRRNQDCARYWYSGDTLRC